MRKRTLVGNGRVPLPLWPLQRSQCYNAFRLPGVRNLSISRPARVHPLRVLFCGSDQFSGTALRALRLEQETNPQSIASIDVLVRPGKPSGRGLKTIRDVPLKRVAQKLGLSVHERDTFTGWTLPKPDGELINLIIAVSFGLFVPPRILKSAQYGGINLHPSLLPDFRGPAPLHHMLLGGETHIGVTLQTLHPLKFDHGTILSQTPSPGFEIPNASHCTYPELLDFIAPKAADMLVQGVRNHVFIPTPPDEWPRPQSPPPVVANAEPGRPLRHAPKITPEDRHVDWNAMTMEEILRRDRILGYRMWSYVQPLGGERKRIVFHGLTGITRPGSLASWVEMVKNGAAEGHVDSDDGAVFSLPVVKSDSQEGPVLFIKQGDEILVPTLQGAIHIKDITVEGGKKMSAFKALSEWIRSGAIQRVSDSMIGTFEQEAGPQQ